VPHKGHFRRNTLRSIFTLLCDKPEEYFPKKENVQAELKSPISIVATMAIYQFMIVTKMQPRTARLKNHYTKESLQFRLLNG
jgi:hypothetical protein